MLVYVAGVHLLVHKRSRVVGLLHRFLDDLFVTPGLRGSGAVDALFTRLREITAERGWSVLRWITMDDNYRARGKYDQVARQTKWVTYDMAPPSA